MRTLGMSCLCVLVLLLSGCMGMTPSTQGKPQLKPELAEQREREMQRVAVNKPTIFHFKERNYSNYM